MSNKGLTIFKSSAGSGKTFTLVKEYLKIVLENPRSYQNILAITFTNKASAEMKERIISELASIAEGKDTAMRKSILLENAGIKTERMIVNAQLALSLILHDYSGFAISTIDSFFYKVIRSVTKEMQLPPVNEIEMDMERVTSEIIDKLFAEINSNKELAEWLEKLMLSKVDDEKGWKIDDELRQIAYEVLKEQFSTRVKTFSAGQIKSFVSDLYKIKKTYESDLQKLGDRGLKLVERAGLSVFDFSHSKSSVATAFLKLKNTPWIFEKTSRYSNALESEENWASKKSEQREELMEAGKQLIPILQAAYDYLDENEKKYISTSEVLRNIYLFGITEDLIRNLKNLREEHRLMLLPDIPRLLQHLISDQDTPFVFEKFGNTFAHIMIDEFQDTSDLQWRNLMPLVNHSLSTGSSAIIVGDAKQSIYRWRNGNVDLLLNGVKKDLQAFKEIIHEKSLNTNYRSQEEIVKFNNEFFNQVRSHFSESKLVSDAFEKKSLEQDALKNKLGKGYVELSFISNEKSKASDSEESEMSDDEMGWKQKAMKRLYETLIQLKKENYRDGDIAILVRQNTEGEEIVRYLFSKGITRIVSPDSLLLRGSLKIQFMISVLKWIENSADQIAQTQILHYCEKYLIHNPDSNSDELFTSFTRNKNSIFRKSLPAGFVNRIGMLRRLPVYEMCEQIQRIFHLHSEPDAYLLRFMEIVQDHSIKENNGIRGFLDWWNENESSDKCSLSGSESKDAISLMSIHKSKGLQFPVVLIPFADWSLEVETRKNNLLWASSEIEPFKEYSPLPVRLSDKLANSYFEVDYSKEVSATLLDNINLLYVAFTRAEERLYIFAKGNFKRSKGGVSELIHQIFLKNSWLKNEEEILAKIGNTIPKTSESNNKTETILAAKSFPASSWQTRIAIAPKGRKRMEAIPFMNTEDLSPRDFGLLVHDVLMSIQTFDDIPGVVAKLNFDGDIRDQEKDVLISILEKMTTDKKTAMLFDPSWQIRTEQEIILPNGAMLRPDRVLIKGEEAIVADYKTGIPKEEHAIQVREYASALEKMGFKKVRKIILYIRKNTDENELLELS